MPDPTPEELSAIDELSRLGQEHPTEQPPRKLTAAEHTEIEWYRVPGADRLWPTREDAAYYNGWDADFADSDIEAVALCCECSGEPCTLVLIGEVVKWPCRLAGGAGR